MVLQKDEKPEICEEINLTQLIFNFFAHYDKKIEYDKFRKILTKIKNNLDEITLHANYCELPSKKLHDQSLSNELWYWISNDFLEKGFDDLTQFETDKPYLKLTQKAKDVIISDFLPNRINQNLSSKTLSTLDNVINSIITTINQE